LYEEYIGLHLKSKKFIDQMSEWQDVLKPKEEE
jgi:DNA repair protein RecO (recombination protein O)